MSMYMIQCAWMCVCNMCIICMYIFNVCVCVCVVICMYMYEFIYVYICNVFMYVYFRDIFMFSRCMALGCMFVIYT